MIGLTTAQKLILLGCIFTIGFASGWRVHGWKTDAGVTRSITAAEKTRQNVTTQVEKITDQAQQQQAATKIVYRIIREKINDQDDQRICFADNAALQLWNDAIAGADQHRPGSAGAPSQPGATQGQESGAGSRATESDAIVTVEQVLTNAAENFEICNSNNIKHNQLIDAVTAWKGRMCVCQQ